MSSHRESLPGEFARRCLVRVFSPKAMESVFDPFLADLQADWLHAKSTRSAPYARLCLLSAYASLAVQVVAFALGSIFGPSCELAPAAASSAPPVDAGIPAARTSRYAAPLLIAALVTFGLFALMSGLIASQPGEVVDDPPMPVTLTRVQKPPAPVREPDPALPPMLEPMPQIPDDGIAIADSSRAPTRLPSAPGEGWTGEMPRVFAGPDIMLPESDRSELPIVRVEPVYPARALDRGIEGWVDVEFTVTEVGAISEPRILASHPSGIFNRAAIRAIERWKYEPKLVDGQPVSRPGMRNRFRFELKKKGPGSP